MIEIMLLIGSKLRTESQDSVIECSFYPPIPTAVSLEITQEKKPWMISGSKAVYGSLPHLHNSCGVPTFAELSCTQDINIPSNIACKATKKSLRYPHQLALNSPKSSIQKKLGKKLKFFPYVIPYIQYFLIYCAHKSPGNFAMETVIQ